jgi:5'-nucleotidase / UDP-sugar diphosphatase
MHLRHVSIRIHVVVFFLLVGLISGCAGHLTHEEAPAQVPLTILFFNDLHGNLKPFEVKDDQGTREVGGIARMSALVRDIREENRSRGVRTIVLMAGDVLQGTPMSTVFRGEPDIMCLNLMGLDASAVGNHEFDFGLDNFLKLKGLAIFPFLSANIVKKDTRKLLCQPSEAIELGKGLSLTIIGVTTSELLTTTSIENVATLDVLDPVASVREVYGKARPLGPVVLLSHSRHQTDRDMAGAMPGLAAIIGGHDQVLLEPYRQVGSVPVFQAFEKGRYLGRIDLEIDRATGASRLISHSYIPIVTGMPEDKQVAAIVAQYDKRLGAQFKEVIGHADTFLDGERERIRYEETSLGDFVADIMRQNTGAQIALLNSGSLRSSIKQGPVTVEDVFKAMPYANELMTTQLTGREVEEALKRSVSSTREDEDGGFLQVSGISFTIAGRQPKDIRVGAGRLPLDPKAVYTVAVPDFLSTGGDGHAVFKGKQYVKTGLPLRELIIDTIRQRGVIAPRTEGRIRRVEEKTTRWEPDRRPHAELPLAQGF